MAGANEIRFTIRQFLAFTVVFSLLLIAIIDRSAVSVAGQAIGLIVLIGLGTLATFGVVEGFTGRGCPTCGTGRMQRIALTTLGFRYYRCDTCRARWKRGVLGAWEPATLPEDAPYFVRKESDDPWTLPPGMIDDEEVVWSKTHTNLLRSKQRRNPDAPRQEKQPPIE